MILKETLRAVVRAQKAELAARNRGILRELLSGIKVKVPHAIIISGIRRCGKSTLLQQLMSKISGHYYLNLDDPRIFNFELADFERLEEIFREEFGKNEHYFFDEIQTVAGWELFVRKLLDQKKKCIITGSNASLLSRELGTKLTGRHLTYELFPFSYAEMLKLASAKPSLKSFEKYIKNGGFPEYLQHHEITMLQELLNDSIARDIIIRHGLKEAKTIKELVIYLLTNIGKEFSYNKLAAYCQVGSVNTIISYISYLEDSYLIFTIPRFDYSLGKQLVSPKKAYSIDVGFARANSASFSADRGRILENIVFLHLRRKYQDIYYYREERECDFVIRENGKVTAVIQVCAQLNEENKEREMGGLTDAMKKLKVPQGVILTLNQEDSWENVRIIPTWKWLLER
ncbi:MAG TPA: ATP-binding protein [Candidatus Nanoarchaeia archaeon]|nr:ATP-binding protein [Candidatus Nanoarchaeia archaeon]